ncbi:MAG: mechanosensitive ion channel family protein [Ignisphaera sp.]
MNELFSALLPLIYRIIAAVIVIVAVYALTRFLTKLLQIFFKGAEAEYIARLAEFLKLFLYLVATIVAANIIAPEIQIFSILLLVIGIAIVVMLNDVLRNIGAEIYVRYHGVIRRGDWIEIEGQNIHVLDFGALGIWGETAKSEKVFVPYSKILNSIVTNRLTMLGLLTRLQILIPSSYNVEYAEKIVKQAIEKIKEELVTEPEINYAGTVGESSIFIVEIRIINYRKLEKIVTLLEKEVRAAIPEARIKA